jgi:PAS domain S-box-containing protein
MMSAYSLRKMADLEPGDHLCVLYETEEEHRALLTPFLRRGLERGEKVLYIVDARTAETVLGYLRDDGLEVEPYLSSGQLSVLTADNVYMREGAFDPDGMISLLRSETEQALAEGYSALRVTGEMSWALRGLPGSERLIEYEAKLNEFFPGSKCLAVCQYDRRSFDPAVLLDILSTHPIAIVGTEVYDNFYYTPPTEFLGHDPSAARLRYCLDNLAERQRVEEALRESEARYRALVEQIPAAIYSAALDELSTTLYFSPQIEKMLGFPQAEWVADPDLFLKQLHPDDRERVLAELTSSRASGEPFKSEYRLFARDGSVVWFRDEAVVVRDGDGNPLFLRGIMLDITERKRAEDALLRSEERYRTLFEESRDAIYIIDRGGEFVSVNQSALNLFAYTREEMIGLNGCEVYAHPGDWHSFRQEIEQKGFVRGYEAKLRKKDGTEMVCLLTSTVRRANDGSILGYQGIIRDITEHKTSEEMRKRYEFIANTSRDFMTLVGKNCVYEAVNESYCRAHNKTREEIIGHTVVDVWGEERFLAQIKAHLEKCLAGSEASFQGWFEFAALGLRCFDVAYYPYYDDEGTVTHAVVVSRDITERQRAAEALRESEERYRSFVHNFQGIAYQGEMSFVPIFFHGAVEEITGYTEDEFIAGKPRWDQVIHPDDLPKIYEDAGKIRSIPSYSTDREYRILRKDGQVRWVHEVIQNICDDSGKPTAVRGALYDVTEHKQMQQSLLRSERLAAMGQLATALAHEINNPLQAIYNHLELVLDFALEPEMRERSLQICHQEVRRLAEITQRVLKFARPDIGGVRCPASIPDLVQQTLALVGKQLQQARIQVTTDFPADLPPVLAAPDQIVQVLLNLIVNAPDVMPDGGLIHITAHVDRDVMVFTLTNNGPPIPAEHIERIFEPFFTTKPGSTGLGLSISHSIIQQHGGTIGAENLPDGQGVTFTITLPIAHPDEGQGAAA